MSLFHDVQLGQVFADQKTFADCVPRQDPAQVEAIYGQVRTQPSFDLKRFVYEHFTVPAAPEPGFVSDTAAGTVAHIERLWEHLTRPGADTANNVSAPHDSRVPLPYPYVVPGGRFQEIFYWDSYFTMLGLRQSGRVALIRGMIQNFAYLIDTVGFIPNGNRTYFLSRSQQPFFALMVQLLAEIDGPQVLATYLPQLQREYDFWMVNDGQLPNGTTKSRHTVTIPDGTILNRYWDELTTPRPESYGQDMELTTHAVALGIVPGTLYAHLRAACESGWDFSSRWCANPHDLATIRTTNIVPVDLHCLLFSLEKTLEQAYRQGNEPERADAFGQYAREREQQISTVFWNDETGFFHDYNIVSDQHTPALTLAGTFPLFVGLATPAQAQRVHDRLRADFLHPGGWVTTLEQTGQQWDWPNGWAPLQWVVYRGLLNYGYTETAHLARDRWLALNDAVFKATGKMTEKYNVVAHEAEDAALTTGGGEYPNQDGFGWTNGVYLALMADRQTQL